MKADGVLNLLKFQCFQSVRMTSSLVRSTMKTLEIQGFFFVTKLCLYRQIANAVKERGKYMKDYIAYCGLDCETCEAHIATLNNDNDLRLTLPDKAVRAWQGYRNMRRLQRNELM